MRGLIVDEHLKVKGAENVYAIGDAVLSGYAPTAQVAAQQGTHIGRAIRDGKDSPFVYNHAGSVCCLGSDNTIAQLLVPFQYWKRLVNQLLEVTEMKELLQESLLLFFGDLYKELLQESLLLFFGDLYISQSF